MILINGTAVKASQKLHGGETISVEARPGPPLQAEPKAIALDVLYEDDDFLIVNKPAGMGVHAGAGNSRGTFLKVSMI